MKVEIPEAQQLLQEQIELELECLDLTLVKLERDYICRIKELDLLVYHILDLIDEL